MYNYKDNGRRKLTEPLYFANWETIRLNLSPGSTARNLWEAMADPKFSQIVSDSDFAQMLRADAWETAGNILTRRGNSDQYTYNPDEFSLQYPDNERLRLFALYMRDDEWMDVGTTMKSLAANNNVEGAIATYLQRLRDASVNFSPAITPPDAFTRSLRANTSVTITGLPGDEPRASALVSFFITVVIILVVFSLLWKTLFERPLIRPS